MGKRSSEGGTVEVAQRGSSREAAVARLADEVGDCSQGRKNGKDEDERRGRGGSDGVEGGKDEGERYWIRWANIAVQRDEGERESERFRGWWERGSDTAVRERRRGQRDAAPDPTGWGDG